MKNIRIRSSLFVVAILTAIGCAAVPSDQSEKRFERLPAEDGVEILTSSRGVKFVRTPTARFENLPDWPYEAKFMEIDGLRQAYYDVGPSNQPPVLLLHGEPSWSYLYRKMIPVLVAAGHRVIAMDHLGMGQSDKPVDINAYSFLGHVNRLLALINGLHLQNITMFCQDWGAVIGLKVAGEHPELFSRIVVGNGSFRWIPWLFKPFPDVDRPNEVDTSLVFPYADFPDQQVPFYKEDGTLIQPVDQKQIFARWIRFAMKSPDFKASQVLEALTWYPLSMEVRAAYDAPFPVEDLYDERQSFSFAC